MDDFVDELSEGLPECVVVGKFDASKFYYSEGGGEDRRGLLLESSGELFENVALKKVQNFVFHLGGSLRRLYRIGYQLIDKLPQALGFEDILL